MAMLLYRLYLSNVGLVG